MAEYRLGSISTGTNSAEVWRESTGERIGLDSLDLIGANRSLVFEFNGDIVVVTDYWDPSYKRIYNLAGASHNEGVQPL